MRAAWASPHKQSENDLWPQMTTINMSIPRFGHKPHQTCQKPSTPLLEASCLGKCFFRPVCQGPSRPGMICTEPSRAGVCC